MPKHIIQVNGINADTTGNTTVSVITTTTGLRSVTPVPNVMYQTTDNAGGNWYYDSSDTTSTDNTGTIIVTGNGKRLKRIIQGDYLVKWFGAKW